MKIKAGNWPFATMVPLPVSFGSLKVNCTPSASTDVRPSVQLHDTGPLSVKEERTVIGGVELARKTVVAATEEG